MMRRTAVPFLALALCAAPFVPARAADSPVAGVVAGSQAEARGDFDAWLAELVAAAAREPESPYAAAALLKIDALMDSAADPTIVEKTLGPVLARGLGDGEIDEALRDVLSDRAHARGEFGPQSSFGRNRGYLRRFAVAGPFGWSSSPLVHRTFAPEARDLDPAAAMAGTWGSVRWMPLPIVADEAWINPRGQIRRGDGVTYSLGRVKCGAARTVALKAYCDDSFAVFVNGERALVADRERDVVHREVWATAHLAPGWNRVLVKVAGDAGFALKLCDPATGAPVLDVEEGDPLEATPLPPAGPAPDPRTYRTPAERALESGGGAAETLATAYLCDDEGRAWDAYLAFERATRAVADADGALAGNARAAFGRYLATFREFPDVQRKLRAKEQFEASLKATPAHNSARVRLAEYVNEDDHPDRAVKALREQAAAQPTASVWMAIARICRQRGWEREAIAAAESALKIAPRSSEAVRFLLEYDRRYGNAEKAGERVRALLAIDAGDSDASSELIAHLRAQGKHEEALALARSLDARWPGSVGWRAQIASILQALGRVDEALAAWSDLEKLVPEEASYPRAIAQILEQRGDAQGAIAAYRRSLRAEPFQPPVWRALARLEGNDADFAAPFEPNADELLAKLPSTEELKKAHPKAVAVTVLDHCVTRVRDDGSAQSVVHMIYKILDEKGVKKYGDVMNAGELLEVRAILPDGRVMAPTGLPGRQFNMEGLVPGTVIDHRYLASQRPTPRGYDGGLFYFQDSEINDEPNPVMLSRFVVIAPESMKLDPVARNYGGGPKVETKDGFSVTTWEKSDVPRIEPERFMPETDEIVPLVDYSRPAPPEDVNWHLLDQRGNTRPTPMLEETVAKLVSPEMDDLAKLKAIHLFVNEHVSGEDQRGKDPTATLLEKAGDRGLLFEALVRVAGIPFVNGAAMPWNGDSRRGGTRAEASAFSMPFLWLEPRGAAPIPFVMQSRHSPFGLLPDAYRGSAAFLASETGGLIRRLPQSADDTQDSTQFAIAIGEKPSEARVEGSIHWRGTEDYDTKRGVAEATEDARRKWAEGIFNRYFASPTLEKVEFPRLEERGVPFEIRLTGTMANYVQPQGEAFVVALGLPRVSMAQRFVERAERVYDLVLDVRDDRLEEFTVDLGPSFELARLPEPHVVFHRLGTYSLTWRDLGGKVAVRREVHLKPARYRADEYKAFVAWCKAIDDAEDRKLELRRVKK